MKVICINHKNKPFKIPQEQWIKEDVIYTVIEVAQMGIQAGKYLKVLFLMSIIQLIDLVY